LVLVRDRGKYIGTRLGGGINERRIYETESSLKFLFLVFI
jgi:hypothetical protein